MHILKRSALPRATHTSACKVSITNTSPRRSHGDGKKSKEAKKTTFTICGKKTLRGHFFSVILKRAKKNGLLRKAKPKEGDKGQEKGGGGGVEPAASSQSVNGEVEDKEKERWCRCQ